MWEHILWNDDPRGNVEHIADNGLGIEDVEHVLANHKRKSVSRSTGNPCVFGYSPTGIYMIVVYEEVDDNTVYPITAYPVAEPKK